MLHSSPHVLDTPGTTFLTDLAMSCRSRWHGGWPLPVDPQDQRLGAEVFAMGKP